MDTARKKVKSIDEAIKELPATRSKHQVLERDSSLPFTKLSGDEFEMLCFLLLRKRYPKDDIYYFGKTADMGRDIIHVKANGKIRLIQCKNYSENVDASKIAAEMAKVFVNVNSGRIPTKPDEVVFFVASGLSSGAQDLIDSQVEWVEQAGKRLKTYLKKDPTKKLLAFAKMWWPFGDRQTGISISEDVSDHHPRLIDQFFTVRKVIDASRDEIKQDVAEIVKAELGSFALHPSIGGAANSPIASLDLEAVRSSFEAASKSLSNWPQTLANSNWIDRPEEETLRQLYAEGSNCGCVLLGEPGSGKSALLARLVKHFESSGVACLGIKADTLDVAIDTIGKLSERLYLPATITDCVGALAANEKVVVLVDQLDALSDLVDLKSERLNVLLDLINQLSLISNVFVIASSRGFEYQHDSRFRTIKIEQLQLSLPGWKIVSEILSEANVDGENWPTKFKEILRAPQNLKIFIEHLNGASEQQVFDSYQGMLEELWRQKITRSSNSDEKSKLLGDVAEEMSDLEVMWLPVARFDKRLSVIEQIVADGLLKFSENKLKFGFQHQTLFSHARARAVAKGEIDFYDFVVDRQHALFVRPTIWSTLGYLREASPEIYKSQMTRLCTADLRLHVQHLLMDFLGRLKNPDDLDEQWLVNWLENDDFRLRAIMAISNSKGWFERLKDSQLSSFMCEPKGSEWQLVNLLSVAINHSPESTLALLRRHWLEDASKDEFTFRIFDTFEHWDKDTVEIVCKIIARTPIHEASTSGIASSVSAYDPRLAPRILKTQYEKQLGLLKAEDDPPIKELSPDATLVDYTVEQMVHAPKRRFCDLLRSSSGRYDMPAIAEAAPLEFLTSMFPKFVETVELSLEAPHHILNRFPSSRSLHYEFEGGLRREMPLLEAIRIALRDIGNNEFSEFKCLLDSHSSTDAMLIQRIFCRTLSEIDPVPAEVALEFLTYDPRRLAIGDFRDRHGDSRKLISQVAQHLTPQQLLVLEEYVKKWSEYHDEIPGEHAEDRLARRKWDRESRLWLLKAVPDGLLSRETKSLVESESTALPYTKHRKEPKPTRGLISEFKSPMSKEQMRLAKDEEILGLFDKLARDSKLERPSHHIGAEIEYASRSLGELSKDTPKRVASIAKQLNPTDQNVAASHIVRDIVESEFSNEDLFELIRDLVGLGFDSADFQDAAAYACYKRVFEVEGLPDDICGFLESWLPSWDFATESVEPEQGESREEQERSVVFDLLGSYSLPNGSYWILSALAFGLLRKKPSDTSRWLKILNEHLKRKDREKVWQIHCIDLALLSHCKQKDAVDFVWALFTKYPNVRDSRFGVRFVVESRGFLGEEAFVEICDQYDKSDWLMGKQVKGELYGVSYLAEDGFKMVDSVIGNVLASKRAGADQFYKGLAFATSNLWKESECRTRATALFLALANIESDKTNDALTDVFLFDKFLPNKCSKEILAFAADNPKLIEKVDAYHFAQMLELFVSAVPDTVLKLANCLLDQLEVVRSDEHRRNFDLSDAALTGIAMTLQRMDESLRVAGLDLFERLLKLGFSNTVQTVQELDNRPVNIAPTTRRRRRRDVGAK